MSDTIKARVAVAKRREDDKTYDVVKRAFAYLGGIDRAVGAVRNVMIKPNYTGLLPVQSGAVTSPEVIDALIGLLKQAGIPNIVIGESCGTIHIGTTKIYEELGVKEVAEKHHVELLDLNKQSHKLIKNPDFIELDEVRVAEAIFDFDLLMNVPVLKTHFITDVTLGLKNMKGVLHPKEKRRFHVLNIHKAIADLNAILPPTFTVVDGLIGQEGLAPAEGTPVNLGLVIAGKNTVAVDSVCSQIMGFDPEKIDHIRYAVEKKLGSSKPDDIETVGEKISEVKHNFAPAEVALGEYENIEIINADACSSCIAAITLALNRMETMGDLKKFDDLQVVIGSGNPEIDNPKKCFLVGNCAQGTYKRMKTLYPDICFIPGCAPPALDVEERIREHYGIDRSDPMGFSSRRYDELDKSK